LIVNDGLVNSVADTVNISTTNSAPVADAGTDQSTYVGDTVTLDGSASSDVDGDVFTFSWSLTTVPAGSAAVLSDAAAVNPTFTVDVSGTYVAQLIVNDGLVNSVADTVNISTTNSAPIADAGTDQSIFVGDTVTLDGSASSDADGDMLTFSWSLTTVPAGSVAVLSDAAAVNPTFTVGVSGTYVAQLIVNDGLVNSVADTVNISTTNSAPVADAGTDQSTFVGDTVTLDGSASSDADGDSLTFNWSFTSVPVGSMAVLSDPVAVNPDFDADLPGTYVVQLIVNDGSVDSAVDTVSITVSQPASLQFSRERYRVNEGDGSAIITVTRVGGSAGTVSVDYATSNDTAIAKRDYTAVSGTLSFASGVTSQSFKITILQDTDAENNESLNISLSNPGGDAGLGSPATSSVRIIDDDDQTDTTSVGSSSGSIDVITLILLFSLYLRNFRKKYIL